MTKKVIKTGLFGRVLRQAYKDKGISLPTNETIVLQKIQRTLLEKPVTQQAQKKRPFSDPKYETIKADSIQRSSEKLVSRSDHLKEFASKNDTERKEAFNELFNKALSFYGRNLSPSTRSNRKLNSKLRISKTKLKLQAQQQEALIAKAESKSSGENSLVISSNAAAQSYELLGQAKDKTVQLPTSTVTTNRKRASDKLKRTKDSNKWKAAAKSHKQAEKAKSEVKDEISLEIFENVKFEFAINKNKRSLIRDKHEEFNKTQLCVANAHANDRREIAIGLDFGTSSTKVVIGDSSLGKSFAVLFRNETDISSYLLPSCLYETQSKVFSLIKGKREYTDLKLALLATPNDEERQLLVIAFLSLVIRYVRAWFFEEYSDVYKKCEIVWKVTLGLPAAYHLKNDTYSAFYDIAETAWVAAGLEGKISRASISQATTMMQNLRNYPENRTVENDIEVNVIPEIAAQVYGFAQSSGFDPKARNFYLMVDVGAGSVDASLFHIQKARGGKWDFRFYTSTVEPYGVMNLHRYRSEWWIDTLKNKANNIAYKNKLISSLQQVMYATDNIRKIPESYKDYFSGIVPKHSHVELNPDSYFFAKKILPQVRGKAYWQAWKSRLLMQNELKGIPVFYCGGGMRMNYYKQLQTELLGMDGYSWLNAQPKSLDLPSKLVAPNLLVSDYDRLSVAYGLSFLEIGKVLKATPMPDVLPNQETSWRGNYIDKDYC